MPILFVISTSSMLIMDQRTMQIKYRIPASEIYKISLSPYFDNVAVFHVRSVSVGSCKSLLPYSLSPIYVDESDTRDCIL